MPIIIDANRANDFTTAPCGHALDIVRRARSRKIIVAVGGELLVELSRTPMRPLIAEWIRSGIAIRVDADLITKQVAQVRLSCKSNDCHVIALARVSGSRLVYTDDNLLIADLKNKTLIYPPAKALKSTTPAKSASTLLDALGG